MGISAVFLTERHCQPLQMKPLGRTTVDYGTNEMWHVSSDSTIATNANEKWAVGKRSNFLTGPTSYTTVHYRRHLGPTAIASSYEEIMLEIRQHRNGQI